MRLRLHLCPCLCLYLYLCTCLSPCLCLFPCPSHLSPPLPSLPPQIEVQKRIDHQNLVRLLGYCVEDRSLVYEFMSNGSLEDRLLSVGGTPPLMWPERCRVAMEVRERGRG